MEFENRHPDLPEVFLTCTYRSRVDQAISYAQGRTAPGKDVTNARPGQSLHNYYPSLAFDIAFKRGKEVFWNPPLFQQFAEIAKSLGLEWGGDWPRFQDRPHFQPLNFTWQMAANGEQPVFAGGLPPGLAPPEPPAAGLEHPPLRITRVLRQGSRGPEVVKLQKRLAEWGYAPGPRDGNFGRDTEAAVFDFQEDQGLEADGIAGPITLRALEAALSSKAGTRAGAPAPEEAPAPPPATLPAEMPDFTVDFVAQLFPAATPRRNIERYLPYVLRALAAEGLGDEDMVLMALATIRTETEGFEPISEYRSRSNTTPGGPHDFDKYDHRASLGNQGPPDGARFKGRGFIQLTGRYNYTQYSKAIGLGNRLVQNPEKANEPAIAASLLARFLKDREAKIRFALRHDNLAAARQLVNGGTWGLSQFRDAFLIGKSLRA